LSDHGETTERPREASVSQADARINLDRSKLLGFDQATDTSQPGEIGANLSAKIGNKTGIKPTNKPGIKQT